MKLTLATQMVFTLSAMEAQALKSEVVDSEHLWLGVLKSEDLLALGPEGFPALIVSEIVAVKEEIGEIIQILKRCGIDPKPARRRLRWLIKQEQEKEGEFSGHRSPRCREVFIKAEKIILETGDTTIGVAQLSFVALSQRLPSFECLLVELGIKRDVLLPALRTTPALRQERRAFPEGETGEVSLSKRFISLARFGRDLVQLAREGKLTPVIGRTEEIGRVLRILSLKIKNNPILVGEAGVGKTCIVEALAIRCAAPDAPRRLRNLKIFDVSLGALVAGTTCRGQFEERLEALIAAASSDPDVILFFDEIHLIVGAVSSTGAMDAASLLKPALARGLIKCIGATTTEEYRRFIEQDAALQRRFQVVWVDEPTRDETVSILRGLRPKFEEHHGVRITDEAIDAAVDLSMRYLTEFRLPDKAVDLIDEACAEVMLQELFHLSGSIPKSTKDIKVEDVAYVVSQRARIPAERLTVDEVASLLGMEETLKKRVKGQDKAIREISATVQAAKAGLKDPRRPVGVFLFMGSTGTGKTELAKALAEFLFLDENRLIRIDMSEFQERHTIARLIGAPPGYVGSDKEGQLSALVRTHPCSVVLFDEIDKAYPDISDIFLQIIDEGMLTDARGRRINFRETIIILTANFSFAAKNGNCQIGFDINKSNCENPLPDYVDSVDCEGNPELLNGQIVARDKWKEYRQNLLNAAAEALRPELLNRIPYKVFFYPLGFEAAREILNKIIEGINQRLQKRGNKVILTEAAAKFLLNEGYSEKDGARKLEQIVEQRVVQPLGLRIMEGGISQGEAITVDFSGLDKRILFSIEVALPTGSGCLRSMS